jgi:hypothetical protein
MFCVCVRARVCVCVCLCEFFLFKMVGKKEMLYYQCFSALP